MLSPSEKNGNWSNWTAKDKASITSATIKIISYILIRIRVEAASKSAANNSHSPQKWTIKCKRTFFRKEKIRWRYSKIGINKFVYYVLDITLYDIYGKLLIFLVYQNVTNYKLFYSSNKKSSKCSNYFMVRRKRFYTTPHQNWKKKTNLLSQNVLLLLLSENDRFINALLYAFIYNSFIFSQINYRSLRKWYCCFLS